MHITPAIMNSSEYFNIVADQFGKLTFKIFDNKGLIAKKISQDIMTGMQNLYVNLSDLSDGTYILNAFHGDTFVKSFKVVKK